MNISIVQRLCFYKSAIVACGLLVSGVVFGQTEPQLPKATGVKDSSIRRPMTRLQPVHTFKVGGHPDWMALTGDAVWVTSSSTNQVLRIDAAKNEITGFVSVNKPCSGLITAFGSLWVPSCGDHSVARVDLNTRKVVATVAASPADSEGGITAGAGSVWIVTAPKCELVRIDPATNKVATTIPIASGSYAPAFADGSVWITSTANNLLTQVDAATNKVVSTVSVGKEPRFLTAGARSIWTLNQGDGTISRVDTQSGKVVATINAGLAGEGGEISFGEGFLWATLFGFPITRIDPATNQVMRQWTGKGGDSIRAGLGSVWLTDLLAGIVWRLNPTDL